MPFLCLEDKARRTPQFFSSLSLIGRASNALQRGWKPGHAGPFLGWMSAGRADRWGIRCSVGLWELTECLGPLLNPPRSEHWLVRQGPWGFVLGYGTSSTRVQAASGAGETAALAHGITWIIQVRWFWRRRGHCCNLSQILKWASGSLTPKVAISIQTVQLWLSRASSL